MRKETESAGKEKMGGAGPPFPIFPQVRSRSIRNMAAMAVAALLVLPMLSFLPAASAGNDAPALRLETGHTEALKGGDYVGFNSSGKAWFGVVYGTAANPGPIRIASLTTRYLGVAEVYDRRGRLLSSGTGIPVESVAAQFLTKIYEFNDANGNGLFDYQVVGDPLSSSQIISHEPVYKWANLSTAWSLSGPAPNGQGGYDFSLSAIDIAYTQIGDRAPTGKLENVTFSFHVSTAIKSSSVKIPVYHITVDRGGVESSKRTGTKEYQAQKLSADFKTDHIITGWDFDQADTAPGRSMLLESHALLGAVIPRKTAEWIKEQFVSDINGTGMLEFTDANDTMQDVSDKSPEAGLSKLAARSGGISLRDGWQRYGSLSWTSGAEVYPEESSTQPVNDTVEYQITGARTLSVINWRGAGSGTLKSVLLLGGFVYPGGYRVVHDPTFSAVAQLLDWGGALAQLLPRGIVGLQMLVAVAGCVAAGAIAVSRRGRRLD